MSSFIFDGMKRLFYLFIIIPFFGRGQMPSYPSILGQFFTNYGYSPRESVDGLNFAKKKDGWYVQIIDRVTEAVKKDQIFWSLKNQTYHPLEGFNTSDEETEKNIETFLSGGSIYFFYGYERCIYFGYSRWAEDIIADFGTGDLKRYSDTLLEGLARAYSAYASKFLWYQYGGEESKDSLKKKLQPLALPSKRRIDSVSFYICKSIEVYKVLSEKNNQYQMLVGNAGMKVFNEQMNAYMHLSMAGHDSLAKSFINAVTPNKTISDLARNYLSACAPNAILFTYGDNDTYPLWYLQVKEGFRKDVAVLHAGMLGLPAYVQMVKRKRVANFSATSAFYGDSSFIYFLKETNESQKKTTLSEFIKQIISVLT